MFTLPGVGYGALGGFPSGKLPELGYATWQWFNLDNAKANLADDVRHALAEFIGCFVDAGPTYTPDDRPYIERFFGSIAANLSSRLPGYTGSNARDVRRALADPKGNLRLYVSLDELEELLEAAMASYNAMPHDGLNGRTPALTLALCLSACTSTRTASTSPLRMHGPASGQWRWLGVDEAFGVFFPLAQRFALGLQQLHNDSTSISLCGQYPHARGRSVRARSAPAITYGYSCRRWIFPAGTRATVSRRHRQIAGGHPRHGHQVRP